MSIKADFGTIVAQLDDALRGGSKAVAFGLYDAAAVVVEEVKKEAAGLSFPKGKPGTPGEIAAAAGIIKFDKTGTGYQTSIGCTGYFSGGFPIPYFVREVENGTSRLQPQPFMQRAAANSRAAAVATGEQTAQGIINEIIGK